MEIGDDGKRLWAIFGRNPINMHKVKFALWGNVTFWRWKMGFDIRIGDRAESSIHEIGSQREAEGMIVK